MPEIPEHIRQKIREAKEKYLKELDLSWEEDQFEEERLTEIPAEVFELEWLEVLNLWNNRLTSISDEIARLTNLTSLYIDFNQLTTLPDAIGNLSNLTSLNITRNQLTTLPDILSQLPNLTSLFLSWKQLDPVPNWISRLKDFKLDLSNNQWTAIPEWIFRFQNLTSLYIDFNQLTTLPDAIGNLSNLTLLHVSDNQLTMLPEAIGNLSNLTSLYIDCNQLTTLPDAIGNLSNLTLLHVSANQLTMLPDAIGNLSNLTVFHLGGNELTTIPEWIAQLQKLTELKLNGLQLTTVPGWIAELHNLTSLDLSGNHLSIIPESIKQLQNLNTLDLGNNQFTNIPDAIFELTSLESLSFNNYSAYFYRSKTIENLAYNQIKEISPQILQLKNLKLLMLLENPIEIPPPEVVNIHIGIGVVSIEKIKNYFRQKEAGGVDYLCEAKLLIVGEAGAGKTTLAKKIEDPNYQLQENEESTEGVDVIQWEFPLPEHLKKRQGLGSAKDNTFRWKFPLLKHFKKRQGSGSTENSFRVNIWDFGGQEIYHATHQFFLTKRSLYALVADTRKEDTDFYYWLNVVELLSDNSPLLIIKNEKQDRLREINERQLRGQFTNLEKTLATNLATNRGLDSILDQIKHYISHLPHVGSELPKTWVRVREALEDDPRNYISLDEYLNICEQNGITDRTFKLQLSEYLHDLGVCLHFQDDPLLKKTVILKPEWGTDAVYMALDNKEVIRKLGKFSKADLAKIWHEKKYENMQDELLQLMMKFQLCYQIPGSSDTYIAPQLLSENQPEYEWVETNNLILRYTYEFMPKGIITRFIVIMNRYIADHRCVWKSGVILTKDNTKAEVIEYYGKREIKIRIAGMHRKEFLTIITYELDKIHDSFNRLKYDKQIPCNCSVCKENQEPNAYKYEDLRKFVQKKIYEIPCVNSGEMVNILGMIDDIMDREEFFGKKEKRFEDMREDFATDIRQLSRKRSSIKVEEQQKRPEPPSDSAAQEEKKTSFRWLHLTDLHRGMKEQPWLWPGVREIFFEDLKKLHEKCGPWDLVLFSGDLTQRGSTEEFQKIDKILKQLWIYLRNLGSSPEFLAVPGNHDLVRPGTKAPSVKLLQQWPDQPDIQEEFWEEAESPYRQVVTNAFEHYTEWWYKQPFKVEHVEPGILPGDFSTTIKKDGANLGILGLNSAFLQLTDADYNGKLALHARQFQAACGGDGPKWAKQHHACLLLTHHPPKWLDHDSQQHLKGEIMAHGRFAVHLCGHLHEAASRETSEGGTEFRRIWQGRSLFGLEYFGQKSQRLHGYTAGTIEIGKKTGRLFFWPREARLQGNQRTIVPDYSMALTDDQHTPPRKFELLQAYEPRVDEG